MSERYIPPEAHGERSPVDETVDALKSRAAKQPARSNGRKFFQMAALFVGLMGPSVAEGHPAEREVGWGADAAENAGLQDERLDYLRGEARQLEQHIANLEATQGRPLSTFEKWKKGGLEEIFDKTELEKAQAELKRVQAEISSREQSLESAGEKWKERRTRQEKVIDISDRANDATDALLASWDIRTDGNKIAIPFGNGYKEFVAGSEFVDIGFIKKGDTLNIIFERTDHTYHTIKVVYDAKHSLASYAGEEETNELGASLE